VPRNDQVTRQWHLLRRLEGPRGASLQELGNSLPRDMPKHLRTLRRDLEALEAAGFPLVTERVDGSTRWRLMDGFRRIPALSFSPTELVALALGRDLLKPLDGTQLRVAVDSALAKITSALPPSALEFARQMRDFFSVGLGPPKAYARHPLPSTGPCRCGTTPRRATGSPDAKWTPTTSGSLPAGCT